MVKSELLKNEKPAVKPFPKMMINQCYCNGMVVLFQKEGKGVVVVPYGAWKVGEYRENWDFEQFVDFDGSVTLTNN